ncbi:MAG: hypothetical protein HY246_19960 [Proteobacteria bacterium]|nr:hypothetical protein [Pseudomonadota bacterium]
MVETVRKRIKDAGGTLTVWAVVHEDLYDAKHGDDDDYGEVGIYIRGIALNSVAAERLAGVDQPGSEFTRWHIDGYRLELKDDLPVIFRAWSPDERFTISEVVELRSEIPPGGIASKLHSGSGHRKGRSAAGASPNKKAQQRLQPSRPKAVGVGRYLSSLGAARPLTVLPGRVSFGCSLQISGGFMHRARAFAAALILAICLAGPAQAQRAAVFNWLCNIEGAPAQLTAQVQAVNSAGIFLDANGLFGGAVATDEVNYYYQGTLVSATGRYSFTGTNQFADFLDLNTNDRFRVQMIVQGQMLLIIINPQGPGPVQYLCQTSARPQ